MEWILLDALFSTINQKIEYLESYNSNYKARPGGPAFFLANASLFS